MFGFVPSFFCINGFFDPTRTGDSGRKTTHSSTVNWLESVCVRWVASMQCSVCGRISLSPCAQCFTCVYRHFPYHRHFFFSSQYSQKRIFSFANDSTGEWKKKMKWIMGETLDAATLSPAKFIFLAENRVWSKWEAPPIDVYLFLQKFPFNFAHVYQFILVLFLHQHRKAGLLPSLPVGWLIAMIISFNLMPSFSFLLTGTFVQNQNEIAWRRSVWKEKGEKKQKHKKLWRNRNGASFSSYDFANKFGFCFRVSCQTHANITNFLFVHVMDYIPYRSSVRIFTDSACATGNMITTHQQPQHTENKQILRIGKTSLAIRQQQLSKNKKKKTQVSNYSIRIHTDRRECRQTSNKNAKWVLCALLSTRFRRSFFRET